MSRTKGSAGWFPLRLWARTLPVVCLQKKKLLDLFWLCCVSVAVGAFLQLWRAGLHSSCVVRAALAAGHRL